MGAFVLDAFYVISAYQCFSVVRLGTLKRSEYNRDVINTGATSLFRAHKRFHEIGSAAKASALWGVDERIKAFVSDNEYGIMIVTLKIFS
ncbi:unnamed protein product [Macrosiphum euphorbiae]|nr:unnamed protein product [Macrosiphum euphorbiae]CAI6370820.1 unnamed protein product [Macrosiphum euphorbiae]CAI6373941.1 unnamed protein product [Macrosiphum euphorbiae]